MIVGHLNTLELLFPPDVWSKVIEWLLKNRYSRPADGEYELRDGLKAIVQTLETKDQGEFFEAHRRDIDLHFCLEGCEAIKVASINALILAVGYDAEKDVALYQVLEAGTTYTLTPGMFAIFFPEDAHLPGLSVPGSANRVRKVVFKINMFVS